MVEHILRARLGGNSGWTLTSAGVFAGSGMPATTEARHALDEIGIDLGTHRSQPVTRELVDGATFIVVMTREHLQDILHSFPDTEGKTFLLTEFSTIGAATDIPDPIGQSQEVYRWTRDQIDSAASDVILMMQDRWGL